MGGERKRKLERSDETEIDKRCNKRREGLFEEAYKFLADASSVESCSLWLQAVLDDYDSYDFSKEELIMFNRVIDMVKAKVLYLYAALQRRNPQL